MTACHFMVAGSGPWKTLKDARGIAKAHGWTKTNSKIKIDKICKRKGRYYIAATLPLEGLSSGVRTRRKRRTAGLSGTRKKRCLKWSKGRKRCIKRAKR